jgi:hypothetical protein
MDIDDLFEIIAVDAPGLWDNEHGPKGWWAVSHADVGIVAYFMDETDAFRFRLDWINRI